jgi:hypothetical protein
MKAVDNFMWVVVIIIMFFVTIAFCVNVVAPDVIEERMIELNHMKFEDGKYILKDSINFTQSDLDWIMYHRTSK